VLFGWPAFYLSGECDVVEWMYNRFMRISWPVNKGSFDEAKRTILFSPSSRPFPSAFPVSFNDAVACQRILLHFSARSAFSYSGGAANGYGSDTDIWGTIGYSDGFRKCTAAYNLGSFTTCPG
jgi:hypothetical protein